MKSGRDGRMDRRRQERFHGPRVLEVAGPPASGKTTLCAALICAFEENGVLCASLAEAAQECPLETDKALWRFNAWTLCETVQRLLERDGGLADWLVVDRGVFDAVAWATYHAQRGLLNRRHLRSIVEFALLPAWNDPGSVTVLLDCDYNVALKRRLRVEGRIVNVSAYAQLRAAYQSARTSYGLRLGSVVTIDTTYDDSVGPATERVLEELRRERLL